MSAFRAERSHGTIELVSALKRAEPDVIVRPADAEIIPPLSDYEPFWRQRIPFLFLSAGRSRVYHTPEDTPDKLDYDKIAATARWLARFVSVTRQREPTVFIEHGALDLGTLNEVGEIVSALSTFAPREARKTLEHISALRATCDRAGVLPADRRDELGMLVGMIEARLQ